MSQAQTIAIVGSTPFAWLLAGLLAHDHSRAVVLVSEPPDPLRLWPNLSLSASPITRPETWALLAPAIALTGRRLSRVAHGSVRRTDLRLQASSRQSRDALGHIRHMVAGFGLTAEADNTLPGSAGLRIRDMWSFNPQVFLRAAPRWLAAGNVALVNASSGLKLNRDGRGRFGTTRLDMVVLADDGEIAYRLPETEWMQFGTFQSWLGLTTTPTGDPGAPICFDLDTGAAICRLESGGWLGCAPETGAGVLNHIGRILPPGLEPRVATASPATRLAARDGAPVLGHPRRQRPYVVAGLGSLDIVLAPLIARLIAGEASGLEAEWAAAHGADRTQPRADVAEFAPAAPVAA